jgi:nicotinamidase/pyrazinamidase
MQGFFREPNSGSYQRKPAFSELADLGLWMFAVCYTDDGRILNLPMKNLFFFDVDTQRDFMLPSGALYVPGAERLRVKLRRIFEFARANDITILSSVDAHTEDDPEFKQFPRHCVKGSEGQRKLEETLLAHNIVLENKPIDRNLIELMKKYQQIVIEKQTLNVFDNPVSERLIRALPPRAVVFGVTTEYCVRCEALGLRRLGIKTALLTDVICALDADSGKSALEEMKNAGVDFVSSDAIIGINI